MNRLLNSLPSRLNRKYIFNSVSKQLELKFDQVQTVLIVKKPKDSRTLSAELSIVKFLIEEFPKVNIVVEEDTESEQFCSLSNLFIISSKENFKELDRTIDFVVTLGGDGTVLHVSSLFAKGFFI